MKRFLNTLKGKITTSVSVFAIAILLLISITTTIKLRDNALQNAEKMALSECRDYSGKITSELDKALLANRSLSYILTASILKDSAEKLNRTQVMNILKEVLTNSPTFLGCYTAWEPNAFDRLDAEYKSTIGHDSTGRFLPYYYRVGNEIKLDPIIGIASETTAAWYYEPKKTKNEHVTDPFYYEGVYMISFLAPIVAEANFYGVTGVDYGMDFMQKLVDGYKMYEGNSKLSIISASGTIVAVTNKPKLAGKNIGEVFQNFNPQFLKSASEITSNYQDTVRTLVPFDLGMSGKKWYVMIETPESVLMKEANVFITTIVLICIVSLCLLIFGINYLVGKLTSPINTIAINAKAIAIGKTEMMVINRSSEEIQILDDSFSELMKSQKGITEVCTGIANGDFTQKAMVRSDEDLLAMSVNKMIDNLVLAAKNDKQRNWSAEGMAKFSDILRAEVDLKQLSDTIISNLIKYLKANQGGIFVLNESDKDDIHLELLACYAYDRKKYLHRKIGIGEGLVGQCYLEKENILLSEIPSNYVAITSGLGNSTPRYLILAPLIYNEKVMGVIEIASFHSIEKHEVEFINKLAESIASTISSVKINERTRLLLESSQQQAEEMRSQEEEIRQNMEELMASQEEMTRKEIAYIEEIKSLKERK